MTNKELNRDIKRLAKATRDLQTMDNDESYRKQEEIKKEWMRLYRAGDRFEAMNKASILSMLRMNLRFRFIPLHTFGIYIEL